MNENMPQAQRVKIHYIPVSESKLLNGDLEQEVNNFLNYLFDKKVAGNIVHQSSYIAIMYPDILDS